MSGTGKPVAITHGTAAGDVSAHTAVIWARAATSALISLEYTPESSNEQPQQATVRVDEETDYTGQIRLTGLQPQTRYQYRVWATSGDETDVPSASSVEPERGTFLTAPAEDTDASVRFAWSGDTYGTDDDPVEPPFPTFSAIARAQPDFFIYLGDTIYADAETPAGSVTSDTDPDEALPIYRNKYKEMRDPATAVAEKTHLQEVLDTVPIYAMWHDHEVENDFDSTTPLLPTGKQTFFEYWPIDTDSSITGEQSGRLYRSFRWGNHLELFIIDTRQYRDPNVETDGRKTMLGDEQLAWLKDGLKTSTATFTLIVSPDPMGIYSSDGWVTDEPEKGYEGELSEIINHLQSNNIENVLVITGDIHQAQVVSYDPNEDQDTEFYEISAGPIGAPGKSVEDLYEPFNPTSYYARGDDFFNFGMIEIDETGESLRIGIRDREGNKTFSKTIEA
jgi:alkaline phosphatase D